MEGVEREEGVDFPWGAPTKPFKDLQRGHTPISPEYNPTPPILDPSYPPHLSGRVVEHQEVWDSSKSSSVESKERLEASYASDSQRVAKREAEWARWTVEEAARRIEAWLQQAEESERSLKRSLEESERWWRWCTNGSPAWVCACTFQGVPTGLWRKATIVLVDYQNRPAVPMGHFPTVEVQLDTPDAFGAVRWWLPGHCQFLQPRDSESPPSWTD